jgi:hypothetical protein
MKRFIQMLLLMLFFAAFTAVVPPGPTKHKQSQYAFIKAQHDNVLLVTAPNYQPGSGQAYGIAIRQGDVEKFSLVNSDLISCSQNQMSLTMTMIHRSGYMQLNGYYFPQSYNGRYRLDIGECFSQDRAISRHS